MKRLGFYEVIFFQRYPDTEAAQYAPKNLESLVSKVEMLELIQPDATLIAAHAPVLELALAADHRGEFSRVPGLTVENGLKASADP